MTAHVIVPFLLEDWRKGRNLNTVADYIHTTICAYAPLSATSVMLYYVWRATRNMGKATYFLFPVLSSYLFCAGTPKPQLSWAHHDALAVCICNTMLHHHHPGGQQPLTSQRTYNSISLSLNQSSLMSSSSERAERKPPFTRSERALWYFTSPSPFC